jgi:uncharacterized protein (DUF2235 family)
MKRLIVCCDGTWQQLRSPYPTNVVKLAQAIKTAGKDGAAQIVFYDEGIGTGDWRDRLRGGVFGLGLDQNIQDAYRFLCWNYEPGDEIYLFGFSRGAYTVRSLGGLIARFGLLSRQHIRLTPQAYDFYRLREADRHYQQKRQEAEQFQQTYKNDVAITLLGCWDTVGSLGIPDQVPIIPLDKWVNQRYRFHNTTLSSTIKHALHAVAVDEIRAVFDVTPMERSPQDEQPLKQVWFPGDHGSVGGGREATTGLSDRTLVWMLDEIDGLGLGLAWDLAYVAAEITPNPLVDFDNSLNGVFKLTRTILRQVSDDVAALDISVIERWRDRSDYRPQNLALHQAYLDQGGILNA